ncbi:glycyl-radical enzyme activating protein, partial [Erysipelotrichaceae bacterium AF15-26LB]
VSKITWETEALHIYLWCFSFFLYSSWGFLMNDI